MDEIKKETEGQLSEVDQIAQQLKPLLKSLRVAYQALLHGKRETANLAIEVTAKLTERMWKGFGADWLREAITLPTDGKRSAKSYIVGNACFILGYASNNSPPIPGQPKHPFPTIDELAVCLGLNGDGDFPPPHFKP